MSTPSMPDWPQFAAAAVLLLTPLPLLFGKGVEFRELDRSWHRLWSAAFSLPWHWVDLARAGAGAWLLRSAIGLSFVPRTTPNQMALGLAAGLLLAGVVVQMLATRVADSFYLPFAYVLAVMAGWFPPQLSAPAIALAITAAFGVRSLAGFLGALPFSVVLVAAGLYRKWPVVIAGALLPLVAALLPLLLHRAFVFAHRAQPADAEMQRAPR